MLISEVFEEISRQKKPKKRWFSNENQVFSPYIFFYKDYFICFFIWFYNIFLILRYLIKSYNKWYIFISFFQAKNSIFIKIPIFPLATKWIHRITSEKARKTSRYWRKKALKNPIFFYKSWFFFKKDVKKKQENPMFWLEKQGFYEEWKPNYTIKSVLKRRSKWEKCDVFPLKTP